MSKKVITCLYGVVQDFSMSVDNMYVSVLENIQIISDYLSHFCFQVVDYYKEACRALENSETASMLGKIQKDWKKLVQMKIYYFAAVAHVSTYKQSIN